MNNLKMLFFVIISVFFSQTVSAMFEDQDSINRLKGINAKFEGLKAKQVAKVMEDENAMGTYKALSKQDKERFTGFFTAGNEFIEISVIINDVIHNKKSILDAVKEAGFESSSSEDSEESQ